MSPRPSGPGLLATDSRYLLSTNHHCLCFVWNLATDFEQAHVAALTDASGGVRDGIVLSDPAHRPDHAVGYALCLALSAPASADGLQLTLFSVVSHIEASLGEGYRTVYRRAGAVFDGLAGVRDWLVTDGVTTYSLACALAPESSWAQGYRRPEWGSGDGEVVLAC